jgi:hypothetical protein
MLNIAVVTLKSADRVKTLDTLCCPVPFHLLFCRTFGYGKARNVAASKFGSSGLMVQFNDDLVLSQKIWNQINSLKHGEFILTHDGEHLCSRVLAIHLEDYWKINGCDESIKYCFEDGDFAYRAQQAGLKLKVLSPDFAKHIPHKHSFYNPKRIVPISWEFCKMYVKYKRNFDKNPLNFFFPFHDYKVVVQHLILRVTFTIIWIIKGVN